jgi:hypothetical protein
MKRALRGLLVALLFCGAGIVMSADKTTDAYMAVDEVSKLKLDTAGADAEAAIARGDLRLLAVYGITLEVPGTTETPSKLREKYGLRILEGTGDAITGPKDQALNKLARKYARTYNQTIISKAS